MLDEKFPIDMGIVSRQEKLTRSGSDAKPFNSRYKSGEKINVNEFIDCEQLTPLQRSNHDGQEPLDIQQHQSESPSIPVNRKYSLVNPLPFDKLQDNLAIINESHEGTNMFTPDRSNGNSQELLLN